MGRKYEETNPNPEAKNFPLGAICKILRPNLWSGSVGEVVTVYDNGKQAGLHRIKITGLDPLDTFHADVWGAHLSAVDALPELGEELPAL